MNKKVFGFNWLFRESDGLLYGLKFRPALIVPNPNSSLFVKLIVLHDKIIPAHGDKMNLIRETDKSLDFIRKNKLYHVSELGREQSE